MSELNQTWDDRYNFIGYPYMHFGQVTITAAWAAGEDGGQAVILANNGALTVTLPLASDNRGKAYWIKKIDAAAGAITIARTGADTIDGLAVDNATLVADQNDAALLMSDGLTGWWVLSAYHPDFAP